MQRKVPIVKTGPVKEAARSCAEVPQRRQTETLPGHPEVPVCARVTGVLDRAGKVRGVQPLRASQGLIKGAENADRKSRGEACDTGDLPTFDEPLGKAREGPFERYCVSIAPDEIVSD